MCGGGGGYQMPKPLTEADLLEDTDNPYKNPNSDTSLPSWKLKPKKTKTKTNKKKLTTSDTYQG